ncbi:MAG: SH3 domain-containing protein [Pseudonocardia sp.]|nr:SH3 domain-containing protein [Pseudonocardia sp.]
MAPKLTLKRPSYRGWTFVIILGVVLAVIALIHQVATQDTDPVGSTGCRLEVTTDDLNVRAGPSQAAEQLDTVVRGDVLDGTATVTDGFRELADGRWVADQFLTPVPGTDCL